MQIYLHSNFSFILIIIKYIFKILSFISIESKLYNEINTNYNSIFLLKF